MKWGNNKFASSPFHHSLLTRVFPISWLCNLKSKDRSTKIKHKKAGMAFAYQNSSLDPIWTEGRFYCADNENCWRLSFGKDRDEARRSTGDINSFSRDFDEFKLGRVTGSSFNSLEWEEMEMARSERNKKFHDRDNKKPKETKKNHRLNKLSPTTECKIKAFEDHKKHIMKMKMETKDKPVDGCTVFDSFAVVKSSFDPQQDFRDSMMQMIAEKGIRQQDELEELLACYLTLNCNKYHDLIIKVFRQVWFELKCQTT